jgi:proteasome lid subunit RPN8/RPN11
MKRRPEKSEKHGRAGQAANPGPRVEMKSHVLREIRQHARSSMSAEICGVLIGRFEGRKTLVEASIQGEEARQGGSHVTFTQDTWTHIYQVKDAQYPEKRIVGWYHSHPGFGVFLSEHDTFIHRNFFSDPSQIAWVYDPHSDEEGCFAWEDGEIQRITEMAVHDDPGEACVVETSPVNRLAEEPEPQTRATPGGRTRIVRWLVLTLSHLGAILLGLVAGALLSPQVIVLPERQEPHPAISAPPPVNGSSTPEERGRK